MLILLALIGCNPGTDPQGPIEGPAALASASAGARIETRMPAARIARAETPATAPLPAGEAVFRDCNGRATKPKPPPPPPVTYRPPSTPMATPTAPAQQAPYPAPAPSPAPAPPKEMATPTSGSAPAGSAAPSGGEGRWNEAPADGVVVGGATGSGGSTVSPDPVDRTSTETSGSRSRDDSLAIGRGDKQGGGDASAGPVAVSEPTPDATVPPMTEEIPAYKSSDGDAAATADAGAEREKNAPERKPAELAKAADTKTQRNLETLGYLADDEAPRPEAEPVTAEEDEDAEASKKPSRWWDWGGVVYLSNDDSMSLASAQRVLYQVMNKRRPKLSEIRPHELLNYFSFDTAPVPEGQMFSVLGSAEQRGDTLSVALAVQGAMPERQPLDLTLVIDRSGSMAAEGRMDYTRRGMELLAGQLRTGDRVDLVLFESRVCTPLENYVVGRDDPALLERAFDALVPMGSTDLDGGLKEAYRLQTARSTADVHGRNRRVMLLTDAFLNTGAVDPGVVSEIGRSFDQDGIRLTGIGVGREFNDAVLDQLTEKGKGAYVYLGSEAVVDRVFGAGFRSLTETIAHDVKFSIDLPESLAMEKFYGEESSSDPEDIQPINYYAGTSQVFLQDLHMRDAQLVYDDPVTMRISWRDARTGEPDALELHTTVGALVDGDTRNLHKAQALIAWAGWTQAWAMGGDACGAGLDDYARVASAVGDDAELAFLSGLVERTCGRPAVAAVPVAYKVRVDSDVPIAEVTLACGVRAWSERLSGGDTVARFTDAVPGSCALTLQGTVAMRTPVEVPKTGGDVRCTVRAGRLICS